jgi:hypothetical protein
MVLLFAERTHSFAQTCFAQTRSTETLMVGRRVDVINFVILKSYVLINT